MGEIPYCACSLYRCVGSAKHEISVEFVHSAILLVLSLTHRPR